MTNIYIELETVKDALYDLGHSGVFWLLVVMIGLDVFSGKAKAIKHNVLDSSIGINGLFKHVLTLLITIIFGVFTRLAGVVMLSYAIALFFIFEYITSILENLDSLGIRMPGWLRSSFNRMREDYVDKVEVGRLVGKVERDEVDMDDTVKIPTERTDEK